MDTPRPGRAVFSGIARLTSTAMIVGFMIFIYGVWHRHDWGQPFAKLLCFTGATALILFLSGHGQRRNDALYVGLVELLLCSSLLLWLCVSYAQQYGPQLTEPPRVDIGYTTRDAVLMLFDAGDNPYRSEHINPRPDLLPEHRGFHYGPMMLVAYAGTALSPQFGYKLTNLTCFALIALCLITIAWRHAPTSARTDRMADVTFVLLIAFGAERMWYETFQQGVNDVLPIALLLLGIVALQSERWFYAGLSIGLSFSAKFAPAVFLIVLLIGRRDVQKSMVAGVLLGLLPVVAFLVWDAPALLNNVFVLRATIGFDSTSLYSITPEELHWIYPTVQLLAVSYFIADGFWRQVDLHRIMVCFTTLLVIMEITFKEVHGNHLLWFFPLFGICLMDRRAQLFSALRESLWPRTPQVG